MKLLLENWRQYLNEDFPSNTIPWENAGGVAILHTSAADTIEKLENLMNEPL